MEHERIFQRLVIPFGHAQDHGFEILSQVELRRTDQVTHVLDEQKVQVLYIQVFQGFLDHVAVQMAGATRVDLDNRGTRPADAFGVVGGLDVSLDDPNPKFVF